MNFLSDLLNAINGFLPLPLLVVGAVAGLGLYAFGRDRRVVLSGMSVARRRSIVAARAEREQAKLRLVQDASASQSDYCPELGQTERQDVEALVRGLRQGHVDDGLRARIAARRERPVVAAHHDEEDLEAAA